MCLLVEILAQCACINISSHKAHLAESVVKAGLSVEQLDGVLLPLGLDFAESYVASQLPLPAEPAERLDRLSTPVGPNSAEW